MQRFIHSFSYIFHPLFVPVYVTLLYFMVAGIYFSTTELYLIFIQVLILTVLLPVSLFYLLRSLGLIKSIITLTLKERRLPLAFYALLLFMLIKHSFSTFAVTELYFYFLGLFISTLLALSLVLSGYKTSLHMLAVTSLTMFVISISAYYHIRFIYGIAFFILCCGFVASSRLQAKEHTPAELLAGTLTGILPQVAVWYLWPAVSAFYNI